METSFICTRVWTLLHAMLMESIECHSLYHQECYDPPVAEADMNDPRSAWYCSNFTKAMSKIVSCIYTIIFLIGVLLTYEEG
jgi:integrator complex subunit 12